MNYEIVDLEEKTVAGLTIRTQNSDPNMSKNIGTLWEKFFSQGVFASIPNKSNANTIGLYTNYESDFSGAYDMMVCCEIYSLENLHTPLHVKTIPAGKYAKFVLHGDVQAVGAFWAELWQMKLNRKYDCDFEEYQDGGDMEHMEIAIYISLKE
ncbi:MAG TPA: GyrI-like domain-containing protein [Oscillospiraceae bacterium]|nr:GyrI-like domain-containing protein [Oscillospiraceae bacterium]